MQTKTSFHRIILSSQARERCSSDPPPVGAFRFGTSSPPNAVRPVSLVILKFRSFFRKKHQFALRLLHPVHQVDFGETSNCISKSKNAIRRRGPCFRGVICSPATNTMQRYYIHFAQSDLVRFSAK